MANIEERKNKDGVITSYRIRASAGYDVNGKQIVKKMSWTPPDGMTKAQIRKELQQQAVLFEQKCQQGLCVDDGIKFSDLADMWMTDYAQNNLKKSTYVSYKMMMRNIKPAIGHIKIGALQPHHLSEFYNSLLGRNIETNKACHPIVNFEDYINVHNGKRSDKPRMKQNELAEKANISLTTIKQLLKGENISEDCANRICAVLKLKFNKTFENVVRTRVKASTVKRYHALISSICSFAVYQGILTSNPCTRVKPPKVTSHEAQFLDEDETTTLVDKLQTAPQPFKTAIQLLLFTGMRRGEMCGLEWSDIDYERKIISIDKNVVYTKETGVYEDTPKTNSSIRGIKVSDYVIELLDEYKKWQNEQRGILGSKWGDSQKIFTNDSGYPLHPTSVSSWFSTFCKHNELKHIPLHSLRHTSASILIMNGVPLNAVSKRLGHACAATTSNIYTHVFKTADEMAAKALDDVIVSKIKHT